MKIRFYTNLDQEPTDESFGINELEKINKKKKLKINKKGSNFIIIPAIVITVMVPTLQNASLVKKARIKFSSEVIVFAKVVFTNL